MAFGKVLAVGGTIVLGMGSVEAVAGEYYRLTCATVDQCTVTGVDQSTGAQRIAATIDRAGLMGLTPSGLQYDAVNDRLIVRLAERSAGGIFAETLTINPQTGDVTDGFIESPPPASGASGVNLGYVPGTAVQAADPTWGPRLSSVESRLDSVETRLDGQDEKIRELADEIETVAAMAAAIDLQRPMPGKSFRVGVTTGVYQSTTALGVSLTGQTGSWDVGIGGSTANGQVLGKAGVGFSW